MEARSIEYEMAMSSYKKEQREMQEFLERILGSYGETRRPLRKLRSELAPRLEGVSGSRMIIEAR